MHDGLILGLLFESALRSLLLGAGVLALLKLARLRDPRAETLAWTLVLVASLLMPFLSRWLPGAVTLHLPRLSGLAAPAGPEATTGSPVGRPGPVAHSLSLAAVFWALYCAIALVGLARLVVGLALTYRFYRTAQPIDAIWAWGRNIRVSDHIFGPLAFGSAILLPADYSEWSQAKLMAVLAHEECHIERGDFFIQLLASAHRALFWFNPFAWWLQARLGELAETASDEAAVRRIQDAPRYAEILLEVSRKVQPAGFVAQVATVGMAHGPSIARRLDHVLAWRPSRALSLQGRVAGAALLLAAALGLAQVHAALAPLGLQPRSVSLHAQPVVWDGGASKAAPARKRAATPKASPASPPVPVIELQAAPEPTPQPITASEPEFTYNPRATLSDPDFIPISSLLMIKKNNPPAT